MNLRLIYFVICVLSYRFSSAQRLVSKGKTITASSTIWDIGRAVDGNTDRGADICGCCAATNQENDPWYKLDLGQQYKIYSISVLGRGGAGDGGGGYGHVLLNMEIKLGTTQSDGQVLTTNTDNVYVYNFTLPTPQEGRYLTLTLLTPPNTAQYFVICELLVYADCTDGRYGSDCQETCGKCENDDPCNTGNGICSNCSTGYKPPLCQECDTRTFGLNCSRKCGYCLNSIQCNTVNGSCPSGCDPGFEGVLCDTTCDKGKYGEKCANSCGNCYQQDTCDAVTGLCTNNCSAGYTGTYCKEACPAGIFGRNCVSSCGYCLNRTICSRFDGSCDAGCELGYKPPFCQQECDDGTYGLDCNVECGKCLNGETCNKRNGICSQCEHGYMEPLCKVPQSAECKTQSPEVKSYQLATAIVGTVAVVVIIGNMVAAICYVIRRRRKQREGPIQSQPDISNPYELANRGAFETEHQYGQTAPVYEEPKAPYEIPK